MTLTFLCSGFSCCSGLKPASCPLLILRLQPTNLQPNEHEGPITPATAAMEPLDDSQESWSLCCEPAAWPGGVPVEIKRLAAAGLPPCVTAAVCAQNMDTLRVALYMNGSPLIALIR